METNFTWFKQKKKNDARDIGISHLLGWLENQAQNRQKQRKALQP